MDNKKTFADIERGASWLGQVVGIIAFIACWKFIQVLAIIVAALVFGDSFSSTGNVAGTVLGIILGILGYYAMLKRFQKKAV